MIKVNRKENMIDKKLIYQVMLDGKPILQMKNDNIQNCHVTEGKHTLQIVTKDYVSKKVTFEYAKGKIVEFECYPIHRDTVFSKIMRKIFLGKLGIALRIKAEFYL